MENYTLGRTVTVRECYEA